MSQASQHPPKSDGPPIASVTTEAPATPTTPPKRRGIFRWIFIPLLIVGVGFVGYRLGQSGTTSSSSGNQSGFGGASGGTPGGSGQSGQASSSSAGQSGAGAGSRQSGANAGSAGSAGQASGGQTTGAGSRSGASAANSGAGAATGAPAGAGQAGNAAGTGSRTQSRGGSGNFSASGSAFSGIVTPVQAEAVKAGTLTTERRLTGTVSASQTVNVSAQTSGTVTDVAQNVGARVGAGQTVLTLSNNDLTTSVQNAQNTLESAQAQLKAQQEQMSAGSANLQQAITSAQAALTNAENNYASMQKLYDIGALARSDLEAQNVQVQNARNSLVAAQTNLANTTRTNASGLTTAQLNVQKAQIALGQARDAAAATKVTAPFDGEITAMNVTQGQFLNANSAAFTLVSSTQQVKVNVPATEASSLPVGAAMTYVVGLQKYPLKVTQNPGSTTTGSVPITAKFTGSQEAAQGTVGSVVYKAKVATGVLVPSTALQIDGDQTYVFTIEQNKAKQHTVTVLGQAGTQSAVSGIEAGAQVISEPPTGLLDGGSVTTSNSRSTSQGPGAGGPPPGGMP